MKEKRRKKPLRIMRVVLVSFSRQLRREKSDEKRSSLENMLYRKTKKREKKREGSEKGRNKMKTFCVVSENGGKEGRGESKKALWSRTAHELGSE